ncbi:hypothetical protein [Streptomyces albus]|uniref:hypothetical protein n=1 Tax=Streptomyces albus TaxID=1888 RepID=UPI0004C4B251|nr:hypothetical protein [Streptomyces albus]
MYRSTGPCRTARGPRAARAARAALAGTAALTALALTAATASALDSGGRGARDARDARDIWTAQHAQHGQHAQHAQEARHGQHARHPRTAQGRTVSFRTPRAGAYFYDFREKLVVSDYKADGYGARAYLTWGSHRASVYAGGGRNSTDEKDLSIKEGTPVWLQLCTTKRGKNLRCTKTRKGYA